MTFGTPLAVLLAILFLIPGFLMRKAVDATLPFAKQRSQNVLELLTLSCINYAFASPFIVLLLLCWPTRLDLANPVMTTRNVIYGAFWILVIFVTPFILGLCVRPVTEWAHRSSFWRKLGLRIIHPCPTGWDYAFARQQQYWLRVMLSDGRLLEGVFRESSLASSEPGERDLFLEDVYEFDEETEQFERIEKNCGMLIRGDQIASITFFSQEAENQSTPATMPNSH